MVAITSISVSSSYRLTSCSSRSCNRSASIHSFALPEACINLNRQWCPIFADTKVTISLLTRSNVSTLYCFTIFFALAPRLCVSAPGTQGGMCFKKGTILTNVRPGTANSENNLIVYSAAWTRWSFFLVGTSYANERANIPEPETLEIRKSDA
jgi:hypothetical protein